MLTVPKIGREQSELPVTTMKVTKKLYNRGHV